MLWSQCIGQQILCGADAATSMLVPTASGKITPECLWCLNPCRAYDGRVDLVSMMIKAGADVNAKNPKGSTALHQAAVCDFRWELLLHDGHCC